ncbi:MAG: hypothetical protein MUC73_05865 [Cyclobacteriaceae bacterium]|jgi:hypothetical protein|nr:hypothetical protein [Cyclobacteriaceae bacterium]
MIKKIISPKHLYYTIYFALVLVIIFLSILQLNFVSNFEVRGIIFGGTAWTVFLIILIRYSYNYIFLDITIDPLIRYGNISFLKFSEYDKIGSIRKISERVYEIKIDERKYKFFSSDDEVKELLIELDLKLS